MTIKLINANKGIIFNFLEYKDTVCISNSIREETIITLDKLFAYRFYLELSNNGYVKYI